MSPPPSTLMTTSEVLGSLQDSLLQRFIFLYGDRILFTYESARNGVVSKTVEFPMSSLQGG